MRVRVEAFKGSPCRHLHAGVKRCCKDAEDVASLSVDEDLIGAHACLLIKD